MDETQNNQPEPLSIEQYQQKCEEYLAGWKRSQADYLNLKKESERNQQELVKFANERLLHSLLPALEQFEMAMVFAPESMKEDPWFKGLRAVQSSWHTILKEIGLEQIPTDGAFDPAVHEAISQESAEGKESGTILRELQSGWRLHGKVLRPAKVILVA